MGTPRSWPIERTHSWINGYGQLRRITDLDAAMIGFCLYLAAALITVRAFIQHARHRYRWDTRPTTKRLKQTASCRALYVGQARDQDTAASNRQTAQPQTP